MKKHLLIGWLIATISVSNLAQACFVFSSNDPNACESISGQWIGKVKATNWLIGQCFYNGTGLATVVDSTGHFSVKVSGDKVSGSFLCPNQGSKTLEGSCHNGAIVFATQAGNLTGQFSNRAGNAKGVLSLSSVMSAEIELRFLRVE